MRLSILSTLAAVLTASAASAQIGFQPAVSVPAGPQPDGVAQVDLDADGDLDLAVSTDAPDKLTLLFNAGGSFGAPVQVFLAGGSGPHTPVACDLDGDGDVDVAVSLKNTNQVQLVVNNGGSFGAGATFPVGAEPRSMARADLDGDTDWDLAVSNRTGNSVSILRNQGGLAFTVTTVAVGNDPRELAFGDFNGDKLPDLAVAVHGDRLVQVLLNQGGGVFVTGPTLSLGQLRPQGLDAGDVDGNGTIDIVASASNNNVEFASVLLNQGGAVFAGAASYPVIGLDASSLVLADLDGDGALDIATANTDSNDVSALRNNGNGTFGAAQRFNVGSEPGHVVAGDVDGNGGPDLVTANNLSSDVSVLKNLAAGMPCGATSYCTPKTTSQGSQPRIRAVNVPSYGAQGFSIAMTGAVAGNPTIAFWSTNGPAAKPFMGGTLCVQGPTLRLPAKGIGAGGSVAYALPVTQAMVGTTRWYQFWFRDPAQPDGTGVGLSDGLEVTFCD